MIQPNRRRQRPAVVVCVCISRTPSIILASLIAALSLSLVSILQQPQQWQWLERDAINDKHSTIPAVRSVPVSVPLFNSSTSAAAAANASNKSLSIHAAVKEDKSHSVSRENRDTDTNDPDNRINGNGNSNGNGTANSTDDSAFTFSLNPSTSPPFVIFYNIYLHPERTDLGIGIVQEQLGQVAKSYAMQSDTHSATDDDNNNDNDNGGGGSPKRKRLTIYYNTVGAPAFQMTQMMDDVCSSHGLDCRHMQHYESGFEEVTLQRAHDFCTQTQTAALAKKDNGDNDDGGGNDYTDIRVVYMHNKGSFTDTSVNKFWRRHLTMAVTSHHCLQPANNTCNVCGLQFWPMWIPFFPGNMWAAKCSYVKKLVAPRNYSSVTASLKDRVTGLVQQDKLSIELFPPDKFPPEPDRYGLDRYAAEHWIGSHPQLVPCDLSDTAGIHYWYTKDRNQTDLNFAMAPRRPLRAPLKLWPVMTDMKKVKLKVLNSPELRSKEYFLLPGYVFKWYTLYHEFPPASSWVWSWFPDGELWRDRIALHGTKLVHWMLT
jgi:hypothetical protein